MDQKRSQLTKMEDSEKTTRGIYQRSRFPKTRKFWSRPYHPNGETAAKEQQYQYPGLRIDDFDRTFKGT